MAKSLQNFLDEAGRIKLWPGKYLMKWQALRYLAEKFEPDAKYTEQDVNAILGSWHTFGDHVLLRRALIEYGFLLRTRDGSCYWKNPEQPAEPEA